VQLAELPLPDIGRMVDLAERYADLGRGGTDASLVAIAERLGMDRIPTFNRRHFAVVLRAHVEAFTLLPDWVSRSTSRSPHRSVKRPEFRAAPIRAAPAG
jgi:hypothetical protein